MCEGCLELVEAIVREPHPYDARKLAPIDRRRLTPAEVEEWMDACIPRTVAILALR
jgi:hypothetical protein